MVDMLPTVRALIHMRRCRNVPGPPRHYSVLVTVYRRILLTDDQEAELLELHHRLEIARRSSDDAEDLMAYQSLMVAQVRVVEAHGLDASTVSISYASNNGTDWKVNAIYPGTTEDQELFRGLG